MTTAKPELKKPMLGLIILVGILIALVPIAFFAGNRAAKSSAPTDRFWERDKRLIEEAFGARGLAPSWGEEKEWGPLLHNDFFSPENNLISADFLRLGEFRQRAVGQLWHKDGEGDGKSSIGTGWLIEEDWVITSRHVWNLTRQPGQRIMFRLFGNKGETWDAYATEVEGAFYVSEELDFVVFQIDGLPDEADKFIEPLYLPRLRRREAPERGDAMNIVQFPSGGSKQIAIQENDLLALDEGKDHLYYTTDTENKSSGSPIFDNDWFIVGLHRGSGKATVDDRQITLNRGIDIVAILDDIQENASDSVRAGLGIASP